MTNKEKAKLIHDIKSILLSYRISCDTAMQNFIEYQGSSEQVQYLKAVNREQGAKNVGHYVIDCLEKSIEESMKDESVELD